MSLSTSVTTRLMAGRLWSLSLSQSLGRWGHFTLPLMWRGPLPLPLLMPPRSSLLNLTLVSSPRRFFGEAKNSIRWEKLWSRFSDLGRTFLVCWGWGRLVSPSSDDCKCMYSNNQIEHFYNHYLIIPEPYQVVHLRHVCCKRYELPLSKRFTLFSDADFKSPTMAVVISLSPGFPAMDNMKPWCWQSCWLRWCCCWSAVVVVAAPARIIEAMTGVTRRQLRTRPPMWSRSSHSCVDTTLLMWKSSENITASQHT